MGFLERKGTFFFSQKPLSYKNTFPNLIVVYLEKAFSYSLPSEEKKFFKLIFLKCFVKTTN